MRRFSMDKRQMQHAKKIAVIHIGRYWTCGSNATSKEASVQGRLESREPSVPRDLAIGIAIQGQGLQAAVAVRFAMRRRYLDTWHA